MGVKPTGVCAHCNRQKSLGSKKQRVQLHSFQRKNKAGYFHCFIQFPPFSRIKPLFSALCSPIQVPTEQLSRFSSAEVGWRDMVVTQLVKRNSTNRQRF